jgi:hypothetical protein
MTLRLAWLLTFSNHDKLVIAGSQECWKMLMVEWSVGKDSMRRTLLAIWALSSRRQA